VGVYYDYGSRRPRRCSSEYATKGTCSSCGKEQLVNKAAWFRKSRPRCTACGGLLDPSEATQDSHPELATKDSGAEHLRPTKKCCICHSIIGRGLAVEDGVLVCNSLVCRKAVLMLIEKACSPGALDIRSATVGWTGGKYTVTARVRASNAPDFKTITVSFEA